MRSRGKEIVLEVGDKGPRRRVEELWILEGTRRCWKMRYGKVMKMEMMEG